MVRETVGAGAGVKAPLELVCTVVVVTVCVVVYDEDGVVWVCADASATEAKKTKIRDRFFTMSLDLGEKEFSNH